jgi:glucose-1-phosphate adenylyltransferase
MVDAGTIVSGASVSQSIVGPSCFLHSYSRVEAAVLLGNNEVGRNALVRRAILDKNVKVPPGATIGVDLDVDRERYHVTDSGIVVLGKNDVVHPD